jgi:hypothetical protein
MARALGTVQDAIVKFLEKKEVASVGEIIRGLSGQIGEVPSSSVRSSLNLNKGKIFERIGYGKYKLKEPRKTRRARSQT